MTVGVTLEDLAQKRLSLRSDLNSLIYLLSIVFHHCDERKGSTAGHFRSSEYKQDTSQQKLLTVEYGQRHPVHCEE